MVFQKTFIIIINPPERAPGEQPATTLTTDDLGKVINKKIDAELSELQKDEENVVLGVSVSSKDDMTKQHAFVATITYRNIQIRKVLTEKNKNEKD
jgi:hypothetical protein